MAEGREYLAQLGVLPLATGSTEDGSWSARARLHNVGHALSMRAGPSAVRGGDGAAWGVGVMNTTHANNPRVAMLEARTVGGQTMRRPTKAVPLVGASSSLAVSSAALAALTTAAAVTSGHPTSFSATTAVAGVTAGGGGGGGGSASVVGGDASHALEMVERRLEEDLATSDRGSRSESLAAHRRALERLLSLIGSRWSGLLRRVKAAYEARLEEAEGEAGSLPQVAARAALLSAAHAQELSEAEQRAERRVMLAQSQAQAARVEAERARTELEAAQRAVSEFETERASLRQQLAELRTSNSTLVAAFRRGESATLEAERRDTERSLEASELRKSVEAAQAEAENLRREASLLRSRIKHMVPAADLQRTERRLVASRAEASDLRERLDAIQRAYAAVIAASRAGGLTSTQSAVTLGESVGSLPPELPHSTPGLKAASTLSATGSTSAAASEASLVAHPVPAKTMVQLLAARLRVTPAWDAGGLLTADSARALLAAVAGGMSSSSSASASAPQPGSLSGGGLFARVGGMSPTLTSASMAAAGVAPTLDSAAGFGGATDVGWTTSQDPMFVRGVAPVSLSSSLFRPRFFVGRGSSSDVPRYLRAHGPVRCRPLTKQLTERLIKAVWIAKAEREAALRRRARDDTLTVPMQDFFWEWLRDKFGGAGQAVEWAYSIVWALQQYSYDSDMDVFLRVLQGRLPEEVHIQSQAVVEQTLEGLRRLDRALSGGRETGRLHIEDLRAYVRDSNPLKRADRLAALLTALAVDPAAQEGSEVDYRALLAETATGDQGPFVETLRSQLLQEYEEFASDVCAAISRESGGVGEDRHVSVAAAVAAIRSVDPRKTEEELTELLGRALGEPPGLVRLESGATVPLDPFLLRLRSGWLVRTQPPPPSSTS